MSQETRTLAAGRRPRLFYGWYVLAVSMLGCLLSSGTSQLFMGVMLKPLTEEFGANRATITAFITSGSLVAGILTPAFGRLADRRGPRVITTVGAVLVGLVYLGLAQLSAVWQLFALYAVGRTFGHHALNGVVPATAAINWFRRMRGRALGLLTMTTLLGGALMASIGQYFVDNHGWRTAFLWLGVVTLAVLVVPSALMLRRRPEDVGLAPDGDVAPPKREGGNRPAAAEFSWTLGEAMRTRTLWLLILGQLIGSGANTAVSFHLVAYYTDLGMTASTAALVLSVYGLSAALSNGLWGYLAERVSPRLVAVGIMLLGGVSVLYLLTTRTLLPALLFAVMFGSSTRGEGTVLGVMTAQYYGRGNFGSINGFVHPFALVAVSLGPLLASLSFDATGSYESVFLLLAVLTLAGAALLWFAREPVRLRAAE